jgi:DNA-binding PadR family transcriptional regulator
MLNMCLSNSRRTFVGEDVLSEERIIEKQVKTFLDIVILAILNGDSMYGYKIIAAIHREFGILLSPASLYPLLHFLENDKLIESRTHKGKTVYHVTPKGKEKFEKKFTAYKLSIHIMTNFIKTHGRTQ